MDFADRAVLPLCLDNIMSDHVAVATPKKLDTTDHGLLGRGLGGIVVGNLHQFAAIFCHVKLDSLNDNFVLRGRGISCRSSHSCVAATLKMTKELSSLSLVKHLELLSPRLCRPY